MKRTRLINNEQIRLEIASKILAAWHSNINYNHCIDNQTEARTCRQAIYWADKLMKELKNVRK